MLHYDCNRCGFHRDIGILPRVYVFAEGRSMPILQRHIWCPRCETITVAESLDEDKESSELRHELRDMHERDLEEEPRIGQPREKLLKAWIKADRDLDLLLADWKRSRTRPARCLRCGNEKIDLPASLFEDLAHGNCGGTLKLTITTVAGTFPIEMPHRYTPEGDLIERGFRVDDQGGRLPLELWWGECEVTRADHVGE